MYLVASVCISVCLSVCPMNFSQSVVSSVLEHGLFRSGLGTLQLELVVPVFVRYSCMSDTASVCMSACPSVLSRLKSLRHITPLCTKETLLFTPKEVKDIYLLQSIIVGVRHTFLLIQIVTNPLNNIDHCQMVM